MVRAATSALLVLLLGGCGQKGSYELNWALTTAGAANPRREIQSTRDCSQVGLDSIEVIATDQTGGKNPTLSVFPCYSQSDGPLGRGPELDDGLYTLEVSGLSAGGQVLTGPVEVEGGVKISGDGFVGCDVDLPTPAACADGVDNDGDGLVDLFDPGCKDATGTKE
jgi:hypothetical protein